MGDTGIVAASLDDAVLGRDILKKKKALVLYSLLNTNKCESFESFDQGNNSLASIDDEG